MIKSLIIFALMAFIALFAVPAALVTIETENEKWQGFWIAFVCFFGLALLIGLACLL